MKAPEPEKSGRAVILLEVLLAVAVFGLAAVALVQLINEIAEASIESQFEMRVINRMESLLEEHGKAPNLRTGKIETPAGPGGVSCFVEVQPIAPQSSQGLPLDDLYRVRVVARWKDGAGSRELTAETYRYAPMYQ